MKDVEKIKKRLRKLRGGKKKPVPSFLIAFQPPRKPKDGLSMVLKADQTDFQPITGGEGKESEG